MKHLIYILPLVFIACGDKKNQTGTSLGRGGNHTVVAPDTLDQGRGTASVPIGSGTLGSSAKLGMVSQFDFVAYGPSNVSLLHHNGPARLRGTIAFSKVYSASSQSTYATTTTAVNTCPSVSFRYPFQCEAQISNRHFRCQSVQIGPQNYRLEGEIATSKIADVDYAVILLEVIGPCAYRRPGLSFW